MHAEDIKAELRKRHGSLNKFEVARSLPHGSVADVLYGKRRHRIALAIANELNMSLDLVFPGLGKKSPWRESKKIDNSRKVASGHRQNRTRKLTGVA